MKVAIVILFCFAVSVLSAPAEDPKKEGFECVCVDKEKCDLQPAVEHQVQEETTQKSEEDTKEKTICEIITECNGRHCQINPSNISQDTIIAFDLENQRNECTKQSCREKQGNMQCDEECNTYACNFDGGDCSLGINPWSNCTAPIKCWEHFMDGICDEVCNNPQCLFDGRDCVKLLQPCNPVYDAYCQKHYANGQCDYGCNNAECNWDGLDCENEPPYLADGLVSVIVLMEVRAFKENLVPFLRDMSHQLRTTVRVKKDALGNEMIIPWNSSANYENLGQKHNVTDTEVHEQSGVKVYLEIDNRKCVAAGDCFSTASEAAEFLAAKANKHTLSQSFPIFQVNGEH